MAVEEGIDSNTLLKLLGGSDMSNIFGQNDGSGFVMGALLGRLLFNPNGNNGWDGGSNQGNTAATQAAISAALADANQANNNAMLLLKDIQDTGQDITSAISRSNMDVTNAINGASQTNLIQQLQNQIANLQGQADIKTGVVAATGQVVNEIHEGNRDVTASLNALNTNMLVGFNNVTREITTDGDKTRALITQNMITELNNELADLRTRAAVTDNGITVTNNISQQQAQAQQQLQIGNLANVLSGLVGEIQRTNQSVVNLGYMSGNAGRQDSVNNKVY
jgi:hypothetical protein